jgi:hypothetical protein
LQTIDKYAIVKSMEKRGEKMKNVKIQNESKIDGSQKVVNLFAKTGESTIAVSTCYDGSSDMTFGFENVTDWRWDESWELDGITVQNIGCYVLPVDCEVTFSGTIEITELPDLLYYIGEVAETVVSKAIDVTQLARDRRL